MENTQIITCTDSDAQVTLENTVRVNRQRPKMREERKGMKRRREEKRRSRAGWHRKIELYQTIIRLATAGCNLTH